MSPIQSITPMMKNTMIRQISKVSIACLLPLAILSACSILPSPSQVNVYQLPESSIKSATNNASPKAISLRINRPNSNTQINSQRILVMPEANLINAYQGARWSDSAPTIVRNRIMNAFVSDGRIGSISSDDRTIYADAELDSYLQSYQTEYINGTPQVVIRINVQLINVNTRKIISHRVFEVTQTTTGVNVPQIVVAYGEALDKLNRQLIDWTLSQIDQK
jgi:cholesterol transport system auxiliary component